MKELTVAALMVRFVTRLWADAFLASETLINAGKPGEAENLLRDVAAIWGLMEIKGETKEESKGA